MNPTVGVIIGGLISFVGSLIGVYYATRAERMKLSFGIYTEIREKLYKPLLIEMNVLRRRAFDKLGADERGRIREILHTSEDLIYYCPTKIRNRLLELETALDSGHGDKQIMKILKSLSKDLKRLTSSLSFRGK